MGQLYGIKCTCCDYEFSVQEGVGMMYSPHAVFYGSCDDSSQNWSIAFPDGYCEPGKPMLNDLVKSAEIKARAFDFIKAGGTPGEYGHELYICPDCNRLHNEFFFSLVKGDAEYEPEYQCSHCRIPLRRVLLKERFKDHKFVFVGGETADLHCPQCGNKTLEYDRPILNWD